MEQGVESDHDAGVRVMALLIGSPAAYAVLTLAAAQRASVRLDQGHLVVADDRGRVEVVDLEARRSVLSITIA
jgi:hypothetical protein